MTEKDLESAEELQREKEGRHHTKVIYFLFSFSLWMTSLLVYIILSQPHPVFVNL